MKSLIFSYERGNGKILTTRLNPGRMREPCSLRENDVEDGAIAGSSGGQLFQYFNNGRDKVGIDLFMGNAGMFRHHPELTVVIPFKYPLLPFYSDI